MREPFRTPHPLGVGVCQTLYIFMALIPHGWIYGGDGCSQSTEREAEHHIKLLKKIFPHHDFKIILDDSGGKNYEKVDYYYE